MTQSSGTESAIVAVQYEAWVYPRPVSDMARAVEAGKYYDLSDPSFLRRKLWPKRIEPDNLSILIAGCGANQAANYALTNPNAQVVGIDLSQASLGHEAYLKQKHSLGNLQLFHLSIGEVGSLGQDFDLIVCTGVLHHLPDPDAGLRCLRDVLRPHGVISAMVYGYYPRFGVYMMQEAFRVLGLKQDAAGIEMVKNTIRDLPTWHHLHSYVRTAPDLGYDAGLVDTFLHPLDRAFTVPQVIQFASRNNLKLQSWLDNLDYSISASIMDNQNPRRRLIETFPLEDQWHLVELLAQCLGVHRFLLCHQKKSENSYIIDFASDKWIDYIPSLRPRIELPGETDTTGPAQANVDKVIMSWDFLIEFLKVQLHFWRSQKKGASPSYKPLIIRRRWHASELTAFEAALLERVDGKRSTGEITRSSPLTVDDQPSLSAAREFFSRMSDWDHLQFEIP